MPDGPFLLYAGALFFSFFSCQADADEKLISSHLMLLGDLLASVEGARGKKFRSLSPELQDSITQLLSNTQWLAKLLNGEVTS